MLDMVFAVFESRGYDIRHFKPEDFDKKAKKRLKDIIRGKMTKQDINFFYENEKYEFLMFDGIKEHAKFLSKKESLPYKQ